jgi:hypothetical protein
MPGVKEIVVIRHERLVDKTCPVCGTPFQGLGRRRYCKRTCADRAFYQRHAERRRATRRERYRQKKGKEEERR